MVTVGLSVTLESRPGKKEQGASSLQRLAGEVEAAPMKHAPALLALAPSIEQVKVLADKLPV